MEERSTYKPYNRWSGGGYSSPKSSMKWTKEQIQILKRKAYGNFSEESLLGKVAELNDHLDRYEKSFLGLYTKHEWAEVERLADEIHAMMNELQGAGTSGDFRGAAL